MSTVPPPRSMPHIEKTPFDARAIRALSSRDGKLRNWPVVYTISSDKDIYVGESINAVSRMLQHLDTGKAKLLNEARIILDQTFNKSVCLDLESFLIRLFAGDGQFQVLNRNDGVTDADYFQRDYYRDAFEEIFNELRADGIFEKSISEIENTDLFKLSPFKALNVDQEIVINDILEGLFDDLAISRQSTAVVEGGPGTGKTIVAIYLLKLLSDIRNQTDQENTEAESLFAEYFLDGYPTLLAGTKVGLVVPSSRSESPFRRCFGVRQVSTHRWLSRHSMWRSQALTTTSSSSTRHTAWVSTLRSRQGQ